MFYLKKAIYSITSNISFSTEYKSVTNTTGTHFLKCFQVSPKFSVVYFPSQVGIINKHFFVI